MPSWTAMTNLAAGDDVLEADLDAIRGNIEYLLEPNYDSNVTPGSGYTVTGTSWAKLDAALDITLVSNGGPVLVLVTVTASHASSGSALWDIGVDGTRLGGSLGGLAQTSIGEIDTLTFHAITKPTAASHVYSIYVKATAGTLTVYNTEGSTQPSLSFSVIEI